MAFNTELGRVEYTASIGQTIFTFLFKIYENTDIKVYQTPSGNTPNDIADLLVVDTDYTVSIDGDNGGSITLIVATTTTDAITIKRQLPTDRDYDYQTSGDLLAQTLNDDQNYQTYLIADQEAKENRSLTLLDSVQGVDTSLPAPEALKLMRWKSTEDGLENASIGDNDVFINIINKNSMTDLLSVDFLSYETVNIRGYYAQNDGGGGIFNYDSTIDKSTANAGTIIDPGQTLANQGNGVGTGCWVRQHSGAISIKWFGAKGDGSTDDTTAIQRAVTFVESLDISATLSFNPGDYKIISPIQIDGGGIQLLASLGSVEIQQFTANTNHFNLGDGTTDGRKGSIIIDGLIFTADRNETIPWTSGKCINVDYQHTIKIRNCTFYGERDGSNILWDAIYINEGIEVHTKDCKFLHFANSGYTTIGTNNTDRRSVDCWLLNPYFTDCEGKTIVIDAFSEASFIDNFAIIGAGDTPLYVNSDFTTENGILHIFRRPNIESSSGVTSGIDINKGKLVNIEGGWIGKFTNSIKFGASTTLCNINGTQLNGRVLSGGDNININAFISDSVPDGSAGVVIEATATSNKVSGSIHSFTGGAVDVSASPIGVVIDNLVTSSITGDLIVGGGYDGGPIVGEFGSNTQYAGGGNITAAATIDLKIGRGFFQVTGATTVSNINLYHPQRTLTIQAGSGGLTFDALGNIRLASNTVSQFKTVTLTCDSSIWFESGRS